MDFSARANLLSTLRYMLGRIPKGTLLELRRAHTTEHITGPLAERMVDAIERSGLQYRLRPKRPHGSGNIGSMLPADIPAELWSRLSGLRRECELMPALAGVVEAIDALDPAGLPLQGPEEGWSEEREGEPIWAVPEAAREKIRAWAESKPEIARLFLFGSRVRGQSKDGREVRADSDLDVAVELAPMDERYFVESDRGMPWTAELQVLVEPRVHLEWLNAKSPHVARYVEGCSILVYERAEG